MKTAIVAGFLLATSNQQLVTAFAAESDVVVKETKGLKFKVPADWPVEERDGAVGPIPIEEYLAQKFSAVNARVEALERRVSELDQRIRSAERELVAQQKTIQALREQQDQMAKRLAGAEPGRSAP